MNLKVKIFSLDDPRDKKEVEMEMNQFLDTEVREIVNVLQTSTSVALIQEQEAHDRRTTITIFYIPKSGSASSNKPPLHAGD